MNQVVMRKDSPPPIRQLVRFFQNPKVLGIIIAMVNYALILLIIMASVLPKQYSLKVGDILQAPISATRDIEDSIATDELKQMAMDGVSPIYRSDEHIAKTVIVEVEQVFDQIDKARELVQNRFDEFNKKLLEKQEAEKAEQGQEESGEETEEVEEAVEPGPGDILTEQFVGEIRKDFPIMLSKDEILTCLNADQAELDQLRQNLSYNLNKLLELNIKQDNLLEAKNNLRDAILSLPLSNEIRILGTTIGISVLKPNMFLDQEATEDEKIRVAENVESVMYKKGQYIIQAGQPVTEQQYIMAQKLGLLKEDKINVLLVLGLALIVLITEIIIILCLAYFDRPTIKNPSQLLMMSLIIWMVLGLALLTSQLDSYLIPAALGGMLLTILIGPKVASIINIALSILFSIMLGNDMGIILMTITGGTVGISICSRAEQRNGLAWAGVLVSGINLITIMGFEMISSGGWLVPLKTSMWGVGSGLLSGIFLVGTLPAWENVFGIVTPIKLVELANPNHPILKRLLLEAPGTYHHSIIVANLAENAAEGIGADGLLARVGAYYHDIGKLKRPYYFRENQLAAANPHDKLSPVLSTHIITSHTKDGVELAKEYKVPKVLQEFISQHHGTTPVIYFYHKAKGDDKDDRIKLEDFRYIGPKPKNREIAIVMMADTVEAAVRSIPDPTPGKIEGLIRRLIKEKLDDNQLDDCHLTLKDLSTIANAFSGVITGIFHERVEYPDVSIKEESLRRGIEGGGKS